MTALCPGTFDPVTNGHLDVIQRCSQRFERVIVVVLENPGKEPLFTLEDRIAMLREATADLPNVEVDAFAGQLLVEYAKRRAADIIVKGLRAVSDYEYEIQMAQMNHRLSKGTVETLFMTTNPVWSYLSSSIVKEVARFGGDVSGLVPPAAEKHLTSRLGRGAL